MHEDDRNQNVSKVTGKCNFCVCVCVFVYLCLGPPQISEDVRGQVSAISATSGDGKKGSQSIITASRLGSSLCGNYGAARATIPHSVSSHLLTTHCSCVLLFFCVLSNLSLVHLY